MRARVRGLNSKKPSGIQISGVTRGTREGIRGAKGVGGGRRNLNSQQQAYSLRPLFNLFLKESQESLLSVVDGPSASALILSFFRTLISFSFASLPHPSCTHVELHRFSPLLSARFPLKTLTFSRRESLSLPRGRGFRFKILRFFIKREMRGWN